MTQNQLEHMLIHNDVMSCITNNHTHLDIHTNQTLIQDLDRILLEHKEAQSRFCGNIDNPDDVPSNQEQADYLINEALLFHAGEITNFLNTANHLDKLVLNTHFDEDDYGVVGTGIVCDTSNNTLKEYTTSHMNLVIRKEVTMPMGFSLVTAYPDMTHPEIQPTNRNLTNHIKETEAYKQADDVGKTYLRYRTDVNNTHLATYKEGVTPDNSMMMLHVATNNPNTHHEIKIKESGMIMRTVSESFDITGRRVKTPVETQYSRMYQHDTGKATKKVNLMNERVFQQFSKDYPDIAQSLQNVRTHFTNKMQQQTQQNPQQTEHRTYTAVAQRRMQVLDAKFGHLTAQQSDTSYQYQT